MFIETKFNKEHKQTLDDNRELEDDQELEDNRELDDNMILEDTLLDFLKAHKKRILSLSELEELTKGEISYELFAKSILDFEAQGILIPVKSHGLNGKSITLHNTYRISKGNLRQDINNEIQSYSIKFNPHINLDIYFSLEDREWKRDLPFIEEINLYLNKFGLPQAKASPPERSFQLIGDEKWIDEKDGRRILDRIKLWDKLKIGLNPDPLMLSINPLKIAGNKHIHLVVENKTPFYNLAGHIKDTDFTSIIYGAGWKVVSNLDRLPSQLGLENSLHKIYYFGDLDAEGISIWHSLYKGQNGEVAIELALDFYLALLKKKYSIGKGSQHRNIDAIEGFKTFFPGNHRTTIDGLLKAEGYLPQEALSKEELIEVWRKGQWVFQ